MFFVPLLLLFYNSYRINALFGKILCYPKVQSDLIILPIVCKVVVI